MLGEKMGTMTAKVVNKVNPANNGLPSFESSTEGSGTLVGVEVQQMSTYKAEMLPSGSMYGECPNSGVVFPLYCVIISDLLPDSLQPR